MHPEIAIVQVIAYTALTLSSVVVAIMSAIFAYRNNFGWKPIALLAGLGLRVLPRSNPPEFQLYVPFEIWNRRKYPVVIRNIEVTLKGMKPHLTDTFRERSPGWNIQAGDNLLFFIEHNTIAPQEHKRHELNIPITLENPDKPAISLSVEIEYFDPRTNSEEKLKVTNENQRS